jgi:hypothetical protein
MFVMSLRLHLFVSLAVCALLAGCGEFRGIPSHGGGKRFDEEQRVVAGSIRQTLADMDFSELQGKRVQISIDAISCDGGGNVTFPGLSGVSLGLNGNLGNGNLVQVVPAASGGGSYLKNDNTNSSAGASSGLSYSPMTTYAATAMSTLPDLGYFRAALEMKSRHTGLVLVPAEPEVMLYVIVDVLGTNRSHTDRVFTSSERLAASCECTYYAQEAKTGRLIFGARRASSEGVYSEQRMLGDKDAHVSRTLFRTQPTRLPIEEPEKPTTQPTLPLEIYVDTKE